MKKRCYGAAFLFLGLAACNTAPQYDLSGTLTDIASDTLLVRSHPITPEMSGRPEMKVDTIPLVNGKFAINLGADVLKQVYIQAKPSLVPDAQGRIPAMSMRAISFVLLPGKHVVVNGSMEDYSLSGDRFYDTLSGVQTQMKSYEKQLDSLRWHCIALEQAGVSSDSVKAAYAPAKQLMADMAQVGVDYIRKHPDEDVSLALLASLPVKIGERIKLFESLGAPVKEGVMKPMYELHKRKLEQEQARISAQEKIKEGAPAPDFTLQTIDGEAFTLSSLKGKYVVLDFWGSWCGWCIKGFPKMKQAYEKHKSKVEFVGIACNDKEENWKQAVAEHKLPWVNVFNAGEPNVAIQYGIAGYPTKMILDKEGKILKKVVGEDPAFYTFLDELLK